MGKAEISGEADIKLRVPLKFRRGGHRRNPVKSLQSALTLLEWDIAARQPMNGQHRKERYICVPAAL